jgi:crotonobetainyl-CoA:carnitine CoA-transferase CaiB-like acyl-CoA transferase
VPGPLHGIRVVDLTTVGMGPYATQILGDMGADVIKVESPAGDAFRDIAPARHAGMGAAFLALNRNKRSIVLDLARAADREILLTLLETADVFVCNLRPQSLERLSLDYESLRGRFPRLIYCGVYGFSERGPYAGRPALDDIVQAMSGLAALQGYNAGAPAYVNSIVADKIGGLTAAGSIAMALAERATSGAGQAIEVPMFELMVSFNLVEHLAGATFPSSDDGLGYERVLAPERRPYRTRDGYISLLPYTTAQWQRFFRLAGRPELAEHHELVDATARSRTINRWYSILAEMVTLRSTAEWLELLKEADVPMAAVAGLDDLLHDPHLRAVGIVTEHTHPTEGEIRTVGIPVTFSRTPGSIRRLAPRLGEHNDEIRAELETPASARES